MAGKYRDANAGASNLELRNTQDLARLVAQLLLLIGFLRAIINQVASKRQRVEGNRSNVWAKLFLRDLQNRAIMDEFYVAISISAACLAKASTPAKPEPETA